MLGVSSAGGLNTLFGMTDAEVRFPHARVIEVGDERPLIKRLDATDDGEVIVETEAKETLVQRVWDTNTETTLEIEPTTIAGGETTLRNGAVDRDGTIGMLYRENGDGTLSYLTDLPVPEEHRTTVRESLPDRADGGPSQRFERSIEETGIVTTADLEYSGEATLDVEIPYSLYARGRNRHHVGDTTLLPTPDDVDFDLETHATIIDALQRVIDGHAQSKESGVTDYHRSAIIAEFVQWIPHATDWESKRRRQYIRAPEESLAELTADCKDAALFLYHLYDAFEFDPVLIYQLPGRAGGLSAKGDKKDEEKRGDTILQYPNHLAVGLPKHEIEPIPEDAVEAVATFDYGGTKHVYVESTGPSVPANYPDSREEMIPILYKNTAEFLQAVGERI